MKAKKRTIFHFTDADDALLLLWMIVSDVIIFCLPHIVNAAGWLYMIIILIYLIRISRT